MLTQAPFTFMRSQMDLMNPFCTPNMDSSEKAAPANSFENHSNDRIFTCHPHFYTDSHMPRKHERSCDIYLHGHVIRAFLCGGERFQCHCPQSVNVSCRYGRYLAPPNILLLFPSNSNQWPWTTGLWCEICRNIPLRAPALNSNHCSPAWPQATICVCATSLNSHNGLRLILLLGCRQCFLESEWMNECLFGNIYSILTSPLLRSFIDSL